MRKYWNVVFSISCQFDTIDAPDLACTNPTHCYFIGKKHSKLGFKWFRFISRSRVLYAERRHVIFNPKESVESPFHRLLNLIRLIGLYWVKLCIIFIGILPCFTLWSCQYLMFYSLITPFWAQQYYASKLHSQQNKKFLKYTKEPYASISTWKINNKLIYVSSWDPLVNIHLVHLWKHCFPCYFRGGWFLAGNQLYEL